MAALKVKTSKSSYAFRKKKIILEYKEKYEIIFQSYWNKTPKNRQILAPTETLGLLTPVYFSHSVSCQRLRGHCLRVGWRNRGTWNPLEKLQGGPRCHQLLCRDGTGCKMGPEYFQAPSHSVKNLLGKQW